MKLVQLGRQPKLSLAELESKFGPESIAFIPPEFAVVDTDTLRIDNFGGLQRVADVLDELPENSVWGFIQKYLAGSLSKADSKTNIGFSFFEAPIQSKNIFSLKKKLKDRGFKVRIVNTNEKPLGNAQVLHNKLYSPSNYEFVAVNNNGKIIIARTVGVQDIDFYSERDYGRPKRDTFVGMLPPKLAQIMINLVNPSPDSTVLDPFCGTGVVVQEALLMGYNAIGTDISKRMVKFTDENLAWLSQKHDFKGTYEIRVSDATADTWDNFDTVVSEIYLGEPLREQPDVGKLKKLRAQTDEILEGALRNLSSQLQKETIICLAVPAWNTNQGLQHLPSLDHLEEFGYNRLSFKHATNQDLVYQREDQIVARELVILRRK